MANQVESQASASECRLEHTRKTEKIVHYILIWTLDLGVYLNTRLSVWLYFSALRELGEKAPHRHRKDAHLLIHTAASNNNPSRPSPLRAVHRSYTAHATSFRHPS
jgi:hypothetical protein